MPNQERTNHSTKLRIAKAKVRRLRTGRRGRTNDYKMGLANKYELPIPIHGLVHVESRVSGMVGEE